MRTRTVAVVCALALLAAGCGSRVDKDDLSASEGLDGSVTTAPTASTPQGDGGLMFGDIEAPCGPAPEGFAPTASDQGVTETSIKIAVISDITGFMKVPTASVAESMQAFVGWCNGLGGINGRELVLEAFDSQITGQLPAMKEACNSGSFALVGSGSVLDNQGAMEMLKCGLIEVPAYTATGEKAMSDDMVQPLPNPTTHFNVGPARWMVENHPDAVKKAAVLASDIPTATIQADRMVEAYEAQGFDFVYQAKPGAVGVESYATYIQQMKAAGVEYVTMVSATPELVKLLRDMQTQGFAPEVIDLGQQFYDPELLVEPGAEGAYVQSNTAFFEEADSVPALQQYLDAYAKIDTPIEPTSLGVQAFSAGLMFATAAKAAGADLTQDRLLEEARKITSWTGGGLHFETSPGTNAINTCFVFAKVVDGAFVRDHPAEADSWDCDDSYGMKLTKVYAEGATLGGK